MTFVATTSPSFARRGVSVPARMKATNWRFERYDDLRIPDAGMTPVLPEVDYLVVGMHAVTAQTLDIGVRLKGVLKHGAGVDNIDIPACTARGIPVMNAPGANANSVAELAIAATFNLARHLPIQHQAILQGDWLRITGCEIAGKTYGVVGFGAIGQRSAQKAHVLGMRVVICTRNPDRYRNEYPQYTFTDLMDLLAQSDVVSLHLSGGSENANMLDATAIAAMKPGALLVNLARGDIVDDFALADALENGHLGGVAIDAHFHEPPDLTRPIYKAPNVLFSPHIGMETEEAITNVGNFVMDDIETLIAGGRPQRCLNPEVFQ